MKNNKKILALSTNACLVTFLLSFSSTLTSCNNNSSTKAIDLGYKQAADNLYDATIDSLVSTDVYGREFGEGTVTSSDRQVGMFYFVWHGNHINDIYDVTKLLRDNPDELWDLDSEISLRDHFHYFSEPLYGYYCSNDPWVIMRHMELLTMSGIDYISLDLTNFALYEENITAVLETLLKLQNQGWNVPLVTSFLNGTAYEADHVTRITTFYDYFYTNPRYDSLWLRDERTGLPLVTIDKVTTYKDVNYFTSLPTYVKDNITFRNARWPYDSSETIYDDASWMDWCYPQRVYHNSTGNYMSVSVAQHTGNKYGTGGTFGLSVNPLTKDDSRYNGNKGRGYDYSLGKNVSSKAFEGTNLEQQWNNAIYCDENIDEVFVTGWNEWIAYKCASSVIRGANIPENADNIVDFCDTCNEEYSRDIEMTKDGYGDNFYLQNMRLTRQFKSFNNVKYFGSYATKSLQNLDWSNARTYLDFEGDAMERHFLRSDRRNNVYYDNNTNRNDISSTKVCHDSNNLYIQIKTVDDIAIDEDMTNNLNVLLSIKDSKLPSWNGYNFIINRMALKKGRGYTSLEAFNNDEFSFSSLEEVPYYLEGDTLSIAIPLNELGVNNKDGFTIDFKVADGMSEQDNIMNYYVDGDSAPIGRLNYRYNSKTK